MRVAELRAGMRCNWKGREMYFLERVQGQRGRTSFFRCPDFVGLNGPDDLGLVEFTDRGLREVERVSGKGP